MLLKTILLVKIENLEEKPQETTGQMNIGDFTEDYETKVRVWNFKRLLSMKYDVVVTNPPYMGSSGMNPSLTKFVKDNYPDSKSDLFAAFIERSGELTKNFGVLGMITQHSWMFLSSYEKLRSNLYAFDIVNMAHLGARAFVEIGGEVVQATTFVMKKGHTEDYTGCYVRLVDFDDALQKEDAFLSRGNRYYSNSDNFRKIPGNPISYWASETLLNIFTHKKLYEYVNACTGMQTGNNELYVRTWFEINIKNTTIHGCGGFYENVYSDSSEPFAR